VTRCIERALVARHFAGTIAPPEERALRQHLPVCDACRGFYERHQLFSELDPQALSPEERIGRGLGLRAGGPGHPWKMVATAAAALAAVAAVALLVLSRAPRDDGFAARGGPLAAMPAESRVFIYDVSGAPRMLRAGDAFGKRDELALSYENDAGKARLMVFGVDEHRHVYWFYPAWTTGTDDPVAVAVAPDAQRHELPDAVRHAFDGSALEVHALFVDAPLSVKQVESLVAHQPAGPLVVAGATDTTTALTVSP
jgi:hypothetical protein